MVPKRILPLLMISMLSFSCDQEEPVIEEQIAGNRITSIHVDNEGVRWFGTENGLSGFDGSIWHNYSIEDGLPDNHIADISSRLNANGTELIIATTQGAGIMGKISNVIHSVSLLFSSNSPLAGDRVTSLAQDRENVTWYGTNEGISIQKDGGWMDSEENHLIKEYPITAISPGPDSISFVGLAGRGIALMDPGIDAVTTVTYYAWPFSPLPSDNIQAIYVNGYHHQWIGTDKGLAFHGNFDPKQQWDLFYEEDGLINNNVLSICGDGSGITWIGTVSGVSRYNGEQWTNYTIEDGLAGDSVFSIAVDQDGSVWFGTNKGASHFDGDIWTSYKMAK
jgi:ligand-binding sensor domain-containing protein